MQKNGERYLEVDPFRITEKGFHKEHSKVSESLFSLSNENFGFRGSFEESFSGPSLEGAYFNGVYEERVGEVGGYRGISNRLCFMVNSPHAMKLRLKIAGAELDLAKSEFSEFERSLDFKSGVLSRSLVWKLPDGKAVRVGFRRVIDMVDREKMHQEVALTPLNFSGSAELSFEIVGEPLHASQNRNYWATENSGGSNNVRWILSRTVQTKMPLFTGQAVFADPETTLTRIPAEQPWDMKYTVTLREGETARVHRTWLGYSTRDPKQTTADASAEGEKKLQTLVGGFEEARAGTAAYWQKVWNEVDIVIEGDDVNQQGIRFSMFQLLQTYGGAVPGTNIGAKGLTGEAYNGNAFWDTETYCLPFYLLTNPKAARGLIEFRYATLPQALERAKALDCEGACFPIATIDGTESCTLWQHASLQFQPSTGVIFALEHYTNVTLDQSLMEEKGLELALQISRFLASRVQYSENLKAYGYYGVMGPDEFQMMVNHNAYTNYMGQRSLRFTLESLEKLKKSAPERVSALVKKLGLLPSELVAWKKIADEMFIPYAEETKLFEQHVGYFDLPHVDIHAIPEHEFPLYHSWSYDRIYRNDMIKQPDVLMFMFLYNGSFTKEQKEANYAFYEPRTIHESSLSPSVHSILALELGRNEEAYNFFKFATRIDLDNYNRNTNEGLHTTALAAAWMNIVYGYGGLRTDASAILLNPVLPKEWSSLSFGFRVRSSTFRVGLMPGQIFVRAIQGPGETLRIWGEDLKVNSEGITLRQTEEGKWVK